MRPSEIQVLVIAVAFIPLLGWTFRGMEHSRKPWLASGLGLVLVAYIATVAEGFVAPRTLNFVEHLAYLAAAICFTVASTDYLKTRTWHENQDPR